MVSQLKPIGTYTIKVIGTLPDFATSTSALFKIEVKKNTFPIFASPLTNVKVPLMTKYSYMFPEIIDPDDGAQTSISTVEDSTTGTLPIFITLKKSSLIINPKLIS